MKNGKKMSDSLNECGRKEELVAYLYGEANATERDSFERHLGDCDGCRSELTAFRSVRRNLEAWQLEQLSRPEVTLRRSRFDLLRELVGSLPVWIRGAAITGALAAALLFSLSIAGTRIDLKDGDFTVSFGRIGKSGSAAPAVSSEEINLMVQNALAEERKKMEESYNARLASLKDELNSDQQSKLQAAQAQHQAELKAAQIALQQEMRRLNRQNASSISAFFARDDSSDPWGDGR
jgi:hypothetical protein